MKDKTRNTQIRNAVLKLKNSNSTLLELLPEKYRNSTWREDITRLDVSNLKLTPQHLEILVELFPSVHSLNLSNTKIRTDALSLLKGLKNLQSLQLYNNKIGDAGVHALKTLVNLRRLYLDSNKINAEGAQALQALVESVNAD